MGEPEFRVMIRRLKGTAGQSFSEFKVTVLGSIVVAIALSL